MQRPKSDFIATQEEETGLAGNQWWSPDSTTRSPEPSPALQPGRPAHLRITPSERVFTESPAGLLRGRFPCSLIACLWCTKHPWHLVTPNNYCWHECSHSGQFPNLSSFASCLISFHLRIRPLCEGVCWFTRSPGDPQEKRRVSWLGYFCSA